MSKLNYSDNLARSSDPDSESNFPGMLPNEFLSNGAVKHKRNFKVEADSALPKPKFYELKELKRRNVELKRPALSKSLELVSKRIIDILGASALLLLTSPIMLFAFVLVKLTSKGPAILVQPRLTQGGQAFRMYKFRSMYVTAEQATGAVWAKENDPRVTPIGRFIRKTRIDELPQLINVLKGEMSIVGPRPERPELASSLRDIFRNFDSRLAVKAGITGLAQVSNGYSACESSYRKKLALDRVYIQRRGFLLDIWIMLKTVITVIFGGSGAR